MADVYGTATLTSASTLSAVGTVVPAGSSLNPIVTSSPASVDFSTAVSTAPPPQAGDVGAVDAWYRIDSSSASTLTLTWSGAAAVGFEVFVAPPVDTPAHIDELTLMAFGTGPTLTAATGPDQVYYVRVHPMDDADNASTGTMSWSFAARDEGELDLLCDPIAYDSPGGIGVSVVSATEEGEVVFEIDGVEVTTTDADDAGTIVELTIPVPSGLTAGSHTITARDTVTGQVRTKGFTVYLYGNNGPDLLPPLMPSHPASPDEVIRWVFEDYLPVYNPVPFEGQESYTFPNNPSAMSSPHPTRVLNPDHTSAPNGQVILTEGEPLPTEWTWEGFCFEQEHYDALEAWHANPRRFWIIDHLQRAWVVTFESLEWTPVRDTGHRWAQRYRAKCFVYAGPINITELP